MRASLAVLLVAALVGGTAAAQDEPRPPRPHRTRFWLDFGFGDGAVRIACAGCDDVTLSTGSTGYIRVGGQISDRVYLGVESFGFGNETFGFEPSDTSIVAETSALTLDVLWFPWRSHVFLKGGVGAASGKFTVTDSLGTKTTAKDTGIGLTFGVGWDIPVSRKIAITLNGAAFITGIGDVVLPTTTVEDVIATMYHFTFGLTFR